MTNFLYKIINNKNIKIFHSMFHENKMKITVFKIFNMDKQEKIFWYKKILKILYNRIL